MSHDRDHDHPPSSPPPKGPQPLISNPKPDCKRPEHPTSEPREPLDPRAHPNRRLVTGRFQSNKSSGSSSGSSSNRSDSSRSC
jgi:hypothetical protein